METGQVHEFTVTVEENTFVQLVVEQRGIDVVIKVTSPAGKVLGEYDTPNGDQGAENVSFLAGAAGTYRITIRPLDANNRQTGHYQITLTDLREASEQQLRNKKNQEAAKVKGIALLAELDATIKQVKAPVTRINAQLQTAELLWDLDEKRAAKYLADAASEAKEYLIAVSVAGEEYDAQYQTLSQLRFQIIQALAKRDADAALNFLRATKPDYSPYTDPNFPGSQESTLEVTIADQIMAKDPKRAYEIARRTLKSGYSPSLLGSVTQLAEKEPALASELMRELVGKLLDEEKLIANDAAATMAMSMVNMRHPPQGSGPDPDPPTSFNAGRLTNDQYKQLLEKMFSEVMAYQQPGRVYSHTQGGLWNVMAGLKGMGPSLDSVIAGATAALDKKQIELTGRTMIYMDPAQQYITALPKGTVEAGLGVIEKAPAELQEQLYIQLAQQAANTGDLLQARQILNEHVTNEYQRRQALANIEQQDTSRALSNGKFEEALKKISAVRSSFERAAQLSQLAQQIGSGQKLATPAAVSLLDQARSILGPSLQAPNQDHMDALLQIARAYSNYDSKRSFEIVDPLVDQFNELCAAAHTLNGFGAEYYEYDELRMREENPLTQIANGFGEVLGSLALVNFDRAKATTDKVRAPEVRLHIYLEIAQQTIQGSREN